MKFRSAIKLGFGGLACLASPALATTDGPLTVSHIGVQGGMVYITFTVPPSAGCIYDTVYAPNSVGNAQYIMSVALTAKAAGVPISRLDYTKAADGQCTIDLIQL